MSKPSLSIALAVRKRAGKHTSSMAAPMDASEPMLELAPEFDAIEEAATEAPEAVSAPATSPRSALLSKILNKKRLTGI